MLFSEAFRVARGPELAPWTHGLAGHLGKTLGLIPGAARVACELVTRVSQSIRDFLSEPQSKLVLFPFTPVLLHLTCSPCVSVLSSACHWPPDVCGGRAALRGAQQALVYGLNSLVKEISQCQRLWVCPWGKCGPDEMERTFWSLLEK